MAVVRREFRPHGGAERVAARVVAELRKAGIEVSVIAHRWEGLPPGVEVRRVPLPPVPKPIRLLLFALLAPRVARAAGGLVHSFDRILAQDVYRAGEGVHREWLVRRRRHLPRHETLLDTARPLHRVLLALDRRVFEGGARVLVANSRQVADEIRRHYRPSAPIELIRTGVDLEAFHPERRRALRPAARQRFGLGDETAFLFMGSGFRRKGLGPLLVALTGIQGPFRLLVAGAGRVGPYRRLAAALGVGERVRFLGVLDDPLPAYAAADAFVLPSLYDPAANTCLEAMAVGLPVVTTRANGAAELIDSGRSGWIVEDPTDFQRQAVCLATLLSTERRTTMGERARAAAEAFPWSRHLGEVLALYDRLR